MLSQSLELRRLNLTISVLKQALCLFLRESFLVLHLHELFITGRNSRLHRQIPSVLSHSSADAL